MVILYPGIILAQSLMNKFKYSLKKAEYFDSYLQAGVSALYLTMVRALVRLLVRPLGHWPSVSLPGWVTLKTS